MPDVATNKPEKVKYGLRNLYYAMQKETPSGIDYETPVRFPGGVSLSISPDGETVEFYADDIVYYSTVINNGYTGDLEVANVHDSFRKDVYGDFIQGGILYENAVPVNKPFALLGEFDTDVVEKRFVLYNVTAGRPDMTNKTSEKSRTPQTEKIALTVRPIELNGRKVVKCSTTSTISEADYNNFFTSVKLPPAISST